MVGLKKNVINESIPPHWFKKIVINESISPHIDTMTQYFGDKAPNNRLI